MNPIISVVIKNTLLIVLIVVNLIFVFTTHIGFNEINYLLIILGALYCIFSCVEALSLARTSASVTHYPYFTNGFVTKHIIKIIFLIACGYFLFCSNSIIKYISALCFTIAITEIVLLVWRYVKNLCFIAFENNTIIISTNKRILIKASSITKIEFRHGLTYLVNNQKKTFTLRSDLMKEKEAFKQELFKWAQINNLKNKIIEN